jgi:feruloyl esterase
LKDVASNFPPPKFAVVHKAAVAACDANDGVKDGVIAAAHRCGFDAASLQCKSGDAPDCLTAPQIAAVRAIYQGPRNSRTGEQILPGFSPGSEMMFPIQTSGPEPFAVSTTFMKALVFKDPKWDFRSFDYDRDVARAMEAGSTPLDVPADGFDAFFASGRKLLLTHGWADGLIPAVSTVNFYEALTRDLGPEKSAAGTRLFMIPGMGHCAGGDGPWMFNAISAIDKWVETKTAPDRIVVSNPPGGPARTRPLCPWPREAAYSGQGSTDEEKNFTCVAPAR